MSSEHDQTAAPGREPSGETPNAEPRAARDPNAQGGAGRHGGSGRERDRDRERRGRRGGGGHAPQQQQRQQPQGQQRRGGSDSSLNMDELRELTELFTAHGLTDFEFENAEIRVRLSRNPAPQTVVAAAPTPAPTVTPGAALTHAAAPTASATNAAQPATTPTAAPAPPPEEKPVELHLITSPIVGTFYRSPSPEAEPFIRAGSHVEPDTVVCIIEAMKLMNEIHAETTGAIEKIYVENGQPVEYGQPLFGVKK